MPKLKAFIQYTKCDPETCNPGTGTCLAVKACRKLVLSQEEAYEGPMVFPLDMCTGCGDCAVECPLNAIIIK